MKLPTQPQPKKLKSLRARYDAPAYAATVHRRKPDGTWRVEKLSCLCSERATADVHFLLAEVDRLGKYIKHLEEHHVTCECCVEFVTP